MKDTIEKAAVEVLRSISGEDIKGSGKVPIRHRALLFAKLCEALECKAAYSRYLATIDKFVVFFERVLRRKQKFISKLCEQVRTLVSEICGADYGLDGIIYSDLLPKSIDFVQRCREQMNYDLKLGKVKMAVRNKFGYWQYGSEFYYANTVRKIAEAIYWRPYVFSTS